MENQFSDLPQSLFDAVSGQFADRGHPITHAMRFMEFVACGLINHGRIHGHPILFPSCWE